MSGQLLATASSVVGRKSNWSFGESSKTGSVLATNIEACSHNECCSGKAASVIHSELVFLALLNWNAKRMHCIILLTVASLVLLYFPTLSHKWQDFRKKGY